MSYNLKLGTKGEQKARQFLEAKGYKICVMNWRNGHQEVDIIARHNKILVFVEVKTRSNEKYGFPEESVTSKKQELLAEAAHEYIHQSNYEGEIRFDIVSILLQQSNVDIYHIEDAFFPQNED